MSISFHTVVDGAIQATQVETFGFPGGELHLKNLPKHRPGTALLADVRGADTRDIFRAMLYADVAHQRQEPFYLLLPYLPAARSDRGEPTGADVYSKAVTSANPQVVFGVDAHSSTVGRAQPNLVVLEPFPLLERALKDTGRSSYDAIIAPDKGALRRASKAAELLGLDCYHADKHRIEETGEITGLKMTEKLPATGRYLVVDDICDGGRTFRELAKVTGMPREQLSLWVTHGVFSGAADKLHENYRFIYTSDSHPGHGRIGVADVVVPCAPYLYQSLHTWLAR